MGEPSPCQTPPPFTGSDRLLAAEQLDVADHDAEHHDRHHERLDRGEAGGQVASRLRDFRRSGRLRVSEGGHTEGDTGGDEGASFVHVVEAGLAFVLLVCVFPGSCSHKPGFSPDGERC